MGTKVALGARRSSWLRKFFGQDVRHPTVAEGRRVFAIGDIHGRYDLLCQLINVIKIRAADPPVQNVLIFLGDYIDRGPDSKRVITYLSSLDMAGYQRVFLKGNHDTHI